MLYFSEIWIGQDSKFRQAFASMVLAPFSSRPQPLISSRQQSNYNRENLETVIFLVWDPDYSFAKENDLGDVYNGFSLDLR